MSEQVNQLPQVNEQQVDFAKQLDIDVSGDTIGVAFARIKDVCRVQFFGKTDLGRPTDKQIQFAQELGIDISTDTKNVGSARIRDALYQLNKAAILERELAVGSQVTHNQESSGQVYEIVSISPEGLVQFKGDDNRRAWASNLTKV